MTSGKSTCSVTFKKKIGIFYRETKLLRKELQTGVIVSGTKTRIEMDSDSFASVIKLIEHLLDVVDFQLLTQNTVGTAFRQGFFDHLLHFASLEQARIRYLYSNFWQIRVPALKSNILHQVAKNSFY